MVSYQVEVPPPVRREIRALPGYVRAQAVRLIDALAAEPRPARARRLRGQPQIYRIWLAGRWRIAYYVDDDLRLIRILRVRPKDDIDYDTLTPP